MCTRVRIIIFFVTAVQLILTHTGCDSHTQNRQIPDASESILPQYERIISLSPSITETLFALGLGDHVVGVTRFCTYPPDAAAKPSVGGYLDPNYEAMVSLEPDLVLLLPEHDEIRTYLDRLGIHHETVANRTVEDILATITSIGDLCDETSRADSLVEAIETRIGEVRRNIPQLSLPRVLISVGRTIGTGTLSDVYVAGSGTSYDELIELAGGVNAFEGEAISYPMISAEGLLHLNPDIIIDLLPEFDELEVDEKNIISEWESAGNVNAVKNGAVHLITGDHAVVPGPRFILFLEELADIIRSDSAE